MPEFHNPSAKLRKDFAGIVRAERKTCLLVTHRIEDALEMSDRILVLKPPGRLAQQIDLTGQRERSSDVSALRDQIAQAMGLESA